MIKHDPSGFSLSPQASSGAFFTAAPAQLSAQALPVHAGTGTQVHVPAVSALFLIAALLVAATELVERLGARAPRRLEAVVRREQPRAGGRIR